MRELENGLPVFKMLLALCVFSLSLQTGLPKTGLNQAKVEVMLILSVLPTSLLVLLTQTSEETEKSRKIIAGFVIIIVTGICVYFTGVFITRPPPSQPPPPTAPYRNPNLSPEERALDLLSRMTLDEKIGQMTLPDRQSISSISDILLTI